MASPTTDFYGAASGQTVVGGRRLYGALGEFIAGIPRSSWAEYTSTNINELESSGPSGVSRGVLEGEVNSPVSNWPGKIAFDAEQKIIIGIGTTNGYISETPSGAHSKNIVFDLENNNFLVRWNPIGRSYGHFYDTNSSRPLNGYFYARGYGDSSLRKMNTSTLEWSESYSLSGLAPAAGTIGSVDVHPNLGASGSVLFLEPTGRLVRFDVSTSVRSVVGTYSGVGNYPLIHYVTAIDSVVFGGGEGGTKLYKLSASGVVSEVTTTLPVTLAANGAGGPFLPDPSGLPRSWHFYDGDSTVRYIDWTTGDWTTFGVVPSGLTGRLDGTIGASIPQLNAFALLTYGGRSGGVTTSKFWILKV